MAPKTDELHPDDQMVGEALMLIGELHKKRNRRPIAATIDALLSSTRAHAGIAIWPTGEQALANLMRAMDAARRFEHAGATSFRAFVEQLETQAHRGQGSEAPVLEEGTHGVRIMTVHGAKGLEFPIVVLCDITSGRKRKRPSRWVDAEKKMWAFPLAGCVPLDLRDKEQEVLEQDEAEGVRVSYVAATRARDLLVVPAVGDARRSGWVDVMHEAIYPPLRQARAAFRAPGCPHFGRDSVRYRPTRGAAGSAQPDASVMPGLHRGGAAGHGVVWWDPHALSLDVPAIGGLRQMELLEKDEQSHAADERHKRWKQRRSLAVARGAQPTLPAQSVTALSHEDPDVYAALAPVQIVETTAPRQGRPHGSRFGSIVHEVLAVVPFDATADVIAQLAQAQATMAGAPSEERDACIVAVETALAHPLMRRAARSLRCRRESPIVHALADGTLAEGIIDLVFREAQGWCVVDFKTDIGEMLDPAYTAQVNLYSRAVSAATGEPASGFLLRV